MPNLTEYQTPPAPSDATGVVFDASAASSSLAEVTSARHISPSVVTVLVRLGEIAILSLAGIAVATGWIGIEETFEDSRYLLAILATALLTSAACQRLELFTIAALTAPLRKLPKIALAWSTAMAALVAMIFLLKIGPDFSRGWLVLWYVAGFASVIVFRYGTSVAVHRWAREGRLNRRAVVFGAGAEGQHLIDALEADHDSDVRICGVFDDRGTDRIANTVRGYQRLGNVDELVAFCRKNPVDLLIVSLPMTAETRLLQILKKLWVLPVDIRLAAHANKLRFRPRAYSFVGRVPLIDLFDKPLADWDSITKSLFDKTIAALALVLLAPVMAAVAIAIRWDSKGPVLFRQKRLGFNNELIDVYKFRSMYTDRADTNAAKLVTKDDPRVTPVGRFIRKTSLDELPQLFNVLLGTLSLVGPRPHALQAKAADRLYHEVVDGYFARHKVRPGITGWAQVNGWRGETDTSDKIQKRVEHDLYYIENWSLFFDVYILMRTPLALLKSENAY